MKITVFKSDISQRQAMTPDLKEKIIGLASATGLVLSYDPSTHYYNPYIELIKTFRLFADCGLKDAKDAIENCQDGDCGAESRSKWTKEQREFFVKNIVKLFNDNSSNPFDERNTAEQFILEGVKCSLESWKKLSYASPIEAVKDFIKRYENKP
jgi:hypothetical protein